MSESVSTAADARLGLYEIMRQDTSFEEKSQQALALGSNYLDVDNAHITRIAPSINHWEAIASTDPEDGDFPPGLELDLDTTYCRRVLEEESSITLHDAPNQGWEDDPAFETHGLHCYHGTPLTVNGDVYGTVCFVSETPRDQPFDEGSTLFAELVARLLEHELEQQWNEAETTRRANSVTVLSRILRHNLRNEMTILRGRISQLAAHLDTDPPIVDEIHNDIDEIIALSDKARKLESVVSTKYDREPVAFEPLLKRAITESKPSDFSAAITVQGPTEFTIEAMPSLEIALSELLENAVKHGGEPPEIDVSVTTRDDTLEVAVTDNGPGLPPQERKVLAEGVETPLVHGSGLGLWMMYWIVTSHDGTIDVTVDDDGTTVIISLPRIKNKEVVGEDETVRALESGVDRFEAVFEESFDAMVLVNDDGRIVDANEQAGEVFGLSKSDLLGRPMAAFTGESGDPEAFWDDLQTSGHKEGRFQLVGPDGTRRTLEYSASADVIPGQHLFIGRDVTGRIERERELAKTTDQLQAVLRTIEAAVFIKDTEGRYQLMNQKCRELLGIDTDTDVVGMTDSDLFPEAVAERIRADDQQVLEAGETVEVQEEIPTKHGSRTHLTLKSPLYDDTGAPKGICAVSTDITERTDRER